MYIFHSSLLVILVSLRMTKTLGIYGLLLSAITSAAAYGSDFKPFVGRELVSSQPNTPIDQRASLLNLGIDYKLGLGLSGGIDVGLLEDNAEAVRNGAVSLKTNLYAKYNWFTESSVSPFIMAGYTSARLNQKGCTRSASQNENFSLSDDDCGAGYLNAFGATYGIGMTFKGSRRTSSAVMIKYLKTTGMADLEVDTLGVSFIY